MNKKIGIVTFYKAANYGAVLQAYALSQALKKCGSTAVFLNFRASETPKKKSGAQAVLLQKYSRLAQRWQEMLKFKRRREQRFQEFVTQYLSASSEIDPADADKLDQEYDAFIVGSDQVWNYEITGLDPLYFLAFAADAKKYSYAASLGVTELSDRLIPVYKRGLEGFAALSVREKSGADLIGRFLDKKVSVHLDPVFLLNSKEWDKIAAKSELQLKTEAASKPETHPGYVLLYALEYNSAMIKEAQALAEAAKKRLVIITGGLWLPLGPEPWCRYGPADFVNLIRQADFVVTNSFHGLAFSILYHKKFRLYTLQQVSSRNTRTTNLLEQLGITSGDSADWAKVEEKIACQRERSLTYLRAIDHRRS